MTTRGIKPGSGKTDGRDSRNVIIKDPDDDVLYGYQHLQRISDTGTSEEMFVVKGIRLEMFMAYLINNWPNHWTVKALTEMDDDDVVTDDMLKDISNELVLTVTDAQTLASYQAQADSAEGEE
jgi:hypothetical protein